MTTTEIDPDKVAELRNALQVQPPATFDWLNLLIYGEPGTGKTYYIGTAEDDPRTTPSLILDVEGGLTTLRSRSEIDTVPISGIKKKPDDKNAAKKSVEYVFEKLAESVDSTGEMYYKTIGIDSLSELAVLDMREIMFEAFQARPESTNIDVPSPREWGISRNHIRNIVRGFRDLPCNVIFTAGLNIIVNEGEAPKHMPNFAGKLAFDIPGLVDIVGFLTATTSGDVFSNQLQVANTKRVRAKDRTQALGGLVENPTIPEMWNLIKNVPIPQESN
jgi:hypothetical protein